MARVLITGANGHLGRRLISALPQSDDVMALVRSERARRVLLQHVNDRRPLTVTIADPADPLAVAAAASGCERVVHLIGTIKQTRHNRFIDAHERPAEALAAAVATGTVKHIVTVSILGAATTSSSECLRSRARTENILLAGPVPVSVIRVPMVLGEGDRASGALSKRARAKRATVFRAASLEQPIYAGDVVTAIDHALRFDAPQNQVFDLAGPQSLSRRELIERAAALLQREPAVRSLPLGVGLALAGFFELVLSNPPITRDMLKVLDHDDAIDPTAAAVALGITLTSLDEMLKRCVSARHT
jgi:uncharacterized protein YbjT (DUF2867 family)